MGRTCAQVLQLLQSSTRPLTVVEIADSMHLHKNSVRFHLDSLIESGFATRFKEHTGTQGRPHLVYLATEDSPAVKDESLLELVQVILRNFVVALPDAADRSEAAGYQWGATLAASATAAPDDPIDSLAGTMNSQGFATRRDGDTLEFTRCPYKLAAVDDADMVAICALHHGMTRGYLRASDSRLTADEVEAGPGCTVAVRRHADSSSR